jgi:hypothetical protein
MCLKTLFVFLTLVNAPVGISMPVVSHDALPGNALLNAHILQLPQNPDLFLKNEMRYDLLTSGVRVEFDDIFLQRMLFITP